MNIFFVLGIVAFAATPFIAFIIETAFFDSRKVANKEPTLFELLNPEVRGTLMWCAGFIVSVLLIIIGTWF